MQSEHPKAGPTGQDAFHHLRLQLLSEVRDELIAAGLSAQGTTLERSFNLVYDVCFFEATDRELGELIAIYERQLDAESPLRDAYTDPEILADIAQRYRGFRDEIRFLIARFWQQMGDRGLAEPQRVLAFDTYHREVLGRPMPFAAPGTAGDEAGE